MRLPFREIATALQATSRNDIKCFARNGISDVTYATLSVIEQSNAATNPYFVNTSFPTGTKVSRGVPDFNVISYSELYEKYYIDTVRAK